MPAIQPYIRGRSSRSVLSASRRIRSQIVPCNTTIAAWATATPQAAASAVCSAPAALASTKARNASAIPAAAAMVTAHTAKIPTVATGARRQDSRNSSAQRAR